MQSRSLINEWLLFWGGWVFLGAVFLLRSGSAYFNGERRQIGFILLMVVYSFFWLGVVEIFYLKDILSGGEWGRANTVFKVSMQVWLWLAVVSGPILIYVVMNKRFLFRAVLALMMVAYLFSLAIYPAKAIFQASLEGRQYSGISSGLDWWQRKFADDYAAYQFLEGVRKNLPENDRVKVIMEAV